MALPGKFQKVPPQGLVLAVPLWKWAEEQKKKSSGEGCSEVKIMGSSPVGPEGHVGVLQASGRAPCSPQSLRWGRERWEGKGQQ